MDLLLLLIPLILILLSQWYINSSYSKYSKYNILSRETGASAARKILDANGLSDVKIAEVSGELTDNFNPKTNIISLSRKVYNDSSIASVAVAAHECGHVIQHKIKYAPIVIRSAIVPVVNFVYNAGYTILLIGILASALKLAMIGFIFMCAMLLFQLVTLPTEFNASRRAKKELLKLGIINSTELPSVSAMLNSAAMTYLASFFASLIQMLRIFLNLNRKR